MLLTVPVARVIKDYNFLILQGLWVTQNCSQQVTVTAWILNISCVTEVLLSPLSSDFIAPFFHFHGGHFFKHKGFVISYLGVFFFHLRREDSCFLDSVCLNLFCQILDYLCFPSTYNCSLY